MEENLPKLAANFSGWGLNLRKSECGIGYTECSDELDHVPLIRRRELLLASKQKPTSLVKEEEENAVSQSQHLQDVFSFPFSAREVGVQLLEQEKNQYCAIPRGAPSELLCSKSEVDSSVNQLLHNDACSEHVEMTAICDSNGTKLNTFASSDQIDCTKHGIGVAQLEKIEAVELKSEISGHSTYDHLDHIALKARQRMLLSRKLFRLEKPVLEGIFGAFSEDVMQQLASQEKGDTSIVGEEALMATIQPCDNPGINASVLCRSMISSPKENMVGLLSTSTTNQCLFDFAESHDDRKSSESDRICSSERISTIAMKLSPRGGQDDVPTGSSKAHSSVKIKDEPLDNIVSPSLGRSVRGDFSLNILPVKLEPRVPNEISEDEVDNMLLRDRMNLLASREEYDVSMSKNYGCMVKIVPSALNYSPIAIESAKPVSISRPRKRKKTATDSVETALEEDAPGLLQVLIDKGVLVDEIKLYGEMEGDEALDESFCEDSFAQLEAVMSKLFSQRQSFFKLATIRCTKDSRASYCLACLISLVEQARYLQFRNWPVEWGWCRDLQSFIFVFARHNRIVLERPEYGYATYFFELVDSVPIDWQIKRLVTAMKLTSCSRLSLIENKALTVGEDLSEGEAQVLLEYGWEPNTGLGTMLKYCDRVVHDRKNESDSSEWRLKIGKMLMDGYNGGTLVTTNIPKKVVESRDDQCPEIKLEF